MDQPAPTNQETHTRFRSTTLWIGLSFLLSFALLIWSFTLPFRQDESPLHRRNAERSQPATTEVDYQESQAEAFRQTALALDFELMSAVREKHRQQPAKPGFREVKQAWQRRVERAQQEVKRLENAKEGSLEAQYLQEVLESFRDAPEA
jgi:hypothetical protein